jgi:ADP-ribosylation factor-like protein 8
MLVDSSRREKNTYKFTLRFNLINNINKMIRGFVNKVLDWVRGKFWSKELELSVVGLQNAGKTTLLNTMHTGEYDEDTIPTIGFNLKEIKKGKVGLKVWDLGG